MRYKTLPKGVEIGPEEALLQSASAIDAAGAMAEQNRDVEGLLEVAALWMKFCEGIVGFSEKVEEAQDKQELKEKELVKGNTRVGFCLPEPDSDDEGITVEEDDDE